MRGRPTSYWAKLSGSPNEDNFQWHPLEAHCADVAACCEALLTQGLTGKRFATLAGLDALTRSEIARLSVLAGLHDIGKFNHGFQAKSDPKSGNTAGHVAETLALMEAGHTYTKRLVASLGYERMVEWVAEERTLFSYLKAVISHHGRLQEAVNFQRTHWQPRDGVDPFEGIASLREALERWFPDAWRDNGDLLPTNPEFQHAFFGLVTLADWIASDTLFFPFEKEGDPDRIEIARTQAEQAISGLWLDFLGGGSQDRLPAVEAVLPNRSPRPLQQVMLDLGVSPPGTITILEAETGSGKTEAALLHWLKLLDAGFVGGLYFALPTRTAATQLQRRVTAATKRVFTDPDQRPPVVLAVPGYLQVDDLQGRRLAPFEVLWPDSASERWRHRGWAAENPKRFLAGAVVVGTIDQVLLSVLRVRHSHMRSAALFRHLLVVDEVHASDLYMNRLLETVLRRHMGAGGHALLMSATLGGEVRTRFLAASQDTRPASLTDLNMSYELAVEAPYPLLKQHSSDGAVSSISFAGAGEGKTVTVETQALMDAPSSVAARGLDAASRGGKVLILRNTVKDCVATQLDLELQAEARGLHDLLHRVRGRATPHHARYARTDRVLLDEAIEHGFGETREAGGRVAVATQTVQQSLDLDADLLITDLCPMDVLLQRIGRLHRHRRLRPSGFESPRVIVLVPRDRDLAGLIDNRTGEARGPHGLGTVYSDLRVVEASWRELQSRGTVKVPDENRVLVEATVHSEALRRIVEELGGPWQAHEVHVLGSGIAHAQAAYFNISDWSVDFIDARPVSRSDTDERIKTRLGEGDRRLVFPEPTEGPFGAPVRELSLPHWLTRDVGEDETPSGIAAHSGRIEFRFGHRAFVYDRLGLRARDGDRTSPQEER